MKEICSYCPNDCVRAEPVKAEGDPIDSTDEVKWCVRWTCDLGGRLGAQRAIKQGEWEPLTLWDGMSVMAVTFGSDTKPTDEGEFRRYVTAEGDVIANNADGELFYTDQNVLGRRRYLRLAREARRRQKQA